MKTWIVLALVAAVGSVSARNTPVGVWKTIDDTTKTPGRIILSTESS